MNTDPNSSGPDMISQLVQALMSTPQMQWVTQQMNQSGAQQNPQPTAGGQQPGPSAGAPDDTQKMGGMNPMSSQNRYSAANDPNADLTERFSALSEQFIDVSNENVELKQKYAQLAEANQAQVEQYALMHKAVVQLEQRAVDSERTVALKALKDRYSHFIELEDEMERCLYSRGSRMSTEEFDAHLVQVEKYAKKSSPTTTMLPTGSVTRPVSTDAAAEAELAQAAVDRYSQKAAAGEFLTYEEALAQVRTERTGA